VHGSIAVVRAMLACLGRFPDCGAASAGEFTRRAFLNGKMDLLDVEALSDLLSAETELQRRLAIDGSASLRKKVSGWYDRMLALRASPKHTSILRMKAMSATMSIPETEQDIRDLADDIGKAERQAQAAEPDQNRVQGCNSWPAERWKSSLLNALADRDVAITSPIPGTTRDVAPMPISISMAFRCTPDRFGGASRDIGHG